MQRFRKSPKLMVYVYLQCHVDSELEFWTELTDNLDHTERMFAVGHFSGIMNSHLIINGNPDYMYMHKTGN